MIMIIIGTSVAAKFSSKQATVLFTWCSIVSSALLGALLIFGDPTRISLEHIGFMTIGFIGLEDDVAICVSVFKYAVDFARAEIKRIKKENGCYFPGYVKKICESYGFGFAAGVQEAFSRQQEENKCEWGLVLVMPKEVKEASRHLGREEFRAQVEDEIVPGGYSRGYFDGKKFDPRRHLPG